MWTDSQRDGRPAEYWWRPLLNAVKFGWCPLLECHAVMLSICDNARLGCKVISAPGKIQWGSNSPRKCIYSVPAQETAKHRAKFGWPPMSNVAAVTKARCGTDGRLLLSSFQALVTLTLTLDRVIRHTVVHDSSTSIYITYFIEIAHSSLNFLL